MEHHPDSPPTFWFQPPVATKRRHTPPIDPVFLIILIPVLSLLFLFFLLPPFLYHTSHILKPASVKSTWDSLNIFLVLFAILCGVMGRKNDDVASSGDVDGFVAQSSDSSSSAQSSGQIVGFTDPDVVSGRFSDGFDVDGYYLNLSRSSEEEFSDVKEIVVDTFVVSRNVTPPPSAPSSNSKRINVKVRTNIESDHDSDELRSEPPPPPLPPTELIVYRSIHKHNKLERKVSDVATAISSLYNNKKVKNKRKLRNNISDISVRLPEIEQTRRTVTPPPPPPPPPSVFQNLFKKGSKHKQIHSVPPPPPPPPPRQSSIFNNIFKSGTKSKRFHSRSQPLPSSIMNTLLKNGTRSKRFGYITAASAPPPLPKSQPLNRRSTSIGKPPLPTKTSGYYEREDYLPLIPMPPPPPPFKMAAMKFKVRGDFVKVRSTHSSVCSSPDHDGVDLVSGMEGSIGPGTGLISFPSSPDVNAKADSFISRLKNEWRMEWIR